MDQFDEEQKMALDELKQMNQSQLNWNDIKKPILGVKVSQKKLPQQPLIKAKVDENQLMEANLKFHLSTLISSLGYPFYYLEQVREDKSFQQTLKIYQGKMVDFLNSKILIQNTKPVQNREELIQKLLRVLNVNNRFVYKERFQINRQPLLKTMDFDIRSLSQKMNQNHKFLEQYEDLEDDEGQKLKEEEEKIKQRPKLDLTQDQLREKIEKYRLEHNLQKDQHVFSLQGQFQPLREYLLSIGWHFNEDFDSPIYEFKFVLKKYFLFFDVILPEQVVNRFKFTKLLTTKYGLAKSIKNCFQFTGTDPNTFFPRCFDLNDESDFEDFLEDYKYTFAESLLRQYMKNPKEKLSEQNIIRLRLSIRILERKMIPIEEKINQVFQKNFPVVSRKEWLFLKDSKFFNEFAKQFSIEQENLEKEVQSLLELMSKWDPQSTISRGNNIWVIKPCGLSRGRGVKYFQTLEQIMPYIACSKSMEWVAQKCVENLLIINGKKFDIRQWILISNLSPLTIWMYDECYIRFCGVEYSLENLNNRFAHLTNFSVQKYNIEDDNTVGYMWTQDELANHIGKEFFYNNVRSQMKQIVVDIIKSSYRAMEGKKNAFEIFGLDFIIDENLKVWLIEVNSSPTFEISTPVTERIVNMGLRDLGMFVENHMFKQKKDSEFGGWKCVYKA